MLRIDIIAGLPVACVGLMLAACSPETAAHLLSENRQIEQGVTSFSSSARPLFVYSDGHSCFSPPPDSAQDLGQDLTIALPLSWSSTSSAEGSFDDQIPLGGRNANALVTRDILFETCLSERRHDLTRDEKIDRWNRVLAALVKINSQPLEASGTSLSQASINTPVLNPPRPGRTE